MKTKKKETFIWHLMRGFAVYITLLTAVFIGFLVLLTPQRISYMTEEYREKVLEFIETDINYALLVGSPDAVDEYIKEFDDLPWLKSVAVTLPGFSQTYSKGESDWRPSAGDYARDIRYTDSKNNQHAMKMILIGAEEGAKTVGGYIHIAIDKKPINNLLRTIIGLYLIVVVASLLVMMPLFISFARKISKPIRSLSSQLEKITPEDPISPEIVSDSSIEEVDTVSKVVNVMLQEQRDHQQNLEDRVIERTSELDRALVKTRLAEESQNNMMMNMSHDLNSPLTSVIGFIDSAREEAAEGDATSAKELLDEALDQARKLGKQIEILLQYSATSEDELIIRNENIEVEQFIGEIIEESESTHSRANNFVEHVHTGSEYVVTDPVKLKRVIVNLLSNANQYCENGVITITTSAKIKFSLIIIDTGVGIPEDELENIFERHFQGSNIPHDGHRGVGIGLSMCRKWVEMLGGTIAVTSIAGRNTCFKIDVPIETNTLDNKTVAGTSRVN